MSQEDGARGFNNGGVKVEQEAVQGENLRWSLQTPISVSTQYGRRDIG